METLRDKAQVVNQEVLELDQTRKAPALRDQRVLAREPVVETIRDKGQEVLELDQTREALTLKVRVPELVKKVVQLVETKDLKEILRDKVLEVRAMILKARTSEQVRLVEMLREVMEAMLDLGLTREALDRTLELIREVMDRVVLQDQDLDPIKALVTTREAILSQVPVS